MYLTEGVRSLMDSFFVKFHLFSYCWRNTVDICWKNCAIFLLEIPKDFRSYFSKFTCVAASKRALAKRPCSKSKTKKTVELFQLMLIGSLYNYLRTNFRSLWRSLLLVKLQTFPVNSTDSRFLQVYCTAQNTF